MDSNAPTEFDMLVIGAGPAGSAAACWAARHGARVALIDKASFPRSKLCGGLFTERSHKVYQEVFGQPFDFSKAITRTEIEFWHDNQCLSVLQDVPPLHMTMRFDLDATLFGLAIDAGATDYSGRSIAQLNGTVVTLQDGEILRGQVLIGADGVKSMTARHLFGAAFDTSTIGFGLEIDAPLVSQETPRPLRIDFAAARWGYGWSFPKRTSTTIGIGGVLASNPDMKAQFSGYLGSLGVDSDPKGFKGHHLPFGDFRKTPGRANVLLAGDAAGLVDPITGEGIALAMKSGQLAAQATMEAIDKNAPHTALNSYQVALKDIHKSLRIASRLRRLMFSPRWQQTFVAAFRRSGTVRRQYMNLLAGNVEYPQLMGHVLRRLPRFVWARLWLRRSDESSSQ